MAGSACSIVFPLQRIQGAGCRASSTRFFRDISECLPAFSQSKTGTCGVERRRRILLILSGADTRVEFMEGLDIASARFIALYARQISFHRKRTRRIVLILSGAGAVSLHLAEPGPCPFMEGLDFAPPRVITLHARPIWHAYARWALNGRECAGENRQLTHAARVPLRRPPRQ